MEVVNHIIPWDIGEATLITTPIVGVQVTTFDCGGVAICVHVSHTIADGFAGATFIHAWSVASRVGVDEVVRPSFDLASIFHARDTSMFKSPPPQDTRSKIVTKGFIFEKQAISRLGAKVAGLLEYDHQHFNEKFLRVNGTMSGCDPGFYFGGKPPLAVNTSNMVEAPLVRTSQPSRVELVACTIWKPLTDVSQAKHGHSRTSVLCLSLNLRGRTGITTSENSLGNFYIQVPTKFMKTGEMELHDLVNILRNKLRSVTASSRKLSNSDDVCITVMNHLDQDMHDGNIDVHHFTSLCKFPFYETDFGWGKPCWVTTPSASFEVVSMVDTSFGTGVEVKVSLNEVDMKEFECHPDFVEFTP
ncbi:LOW QUALITY PROTEIN: hypothetical protein RJ640_018818 [Escallonia rubra]|uniref:Uncharacterized protein n=1 Tax=Escallonia rubra TaxID=112253 RepID=A0AA88S2K8_9ASTE|nr:LOW QUALITY PROTEIN: hypothetical protein RJ640_018818 [Escallonia rubra]